MSKLRNGMIFYNFRNPWKNLIIEIFYFTVIPRVLIDVCKLLNFLAMVPKTSEIRVIE